MQFMVFTDKMVEGVAAIDHQHARMIDILNELYEVVLVKNASTSLEKVFDDLLRFTSEHFATEEKLFADNGYPKLAEHRAQHEALTRRLAEFRRANRGDNDTILASDLLHFLKQWLNDHMLNADKDACRYLNGLGIR